MLKDAKMTFTTKLREGQQVSKPGAKNSWRFCKHTLQKGSAWSYGWHCPVLSQWNIPDHTKTVFLIWGFVRKFSSNSNLLTNIVLFQIFWSVPIKNKFHTCKWFTRPASFQYTIYISTPQWLYYALNRRPLPLSWWSKSRLHTSKGSEKVTAYTDEAKLHKYRPDDQYYIYMACNINNIHETVKRHKAFTKFAIMVLKKKAKGYKIQRPSRNQPHRTYSKDSSKDT
jgi:hypothetical protein